MVTRTGWLLAAACVAALGAGCGGGSSSPSAPSGGGGGTGSGGGTTDPGTTITISSSGVVSPKTLTVKAGTLVTFVNNDRTPHDMNSDPHPEHTDCPAINQVGFLQAGQSKQTGALN